MVGKIDVKDVVDHPDGSSTVIFEFDEAAKKALINEGLASLLDKAVRAHLTEDEDGISELEKVWNSEEEDEPVNFDNNNEPYDLYPNKFRRWMDHLESLKE
jgi:hypothetical protein